MSVQEPDKVPPQTARRPATWIIALAAIVVVVALAAAFMLGRTTSTPSQNAVVQASPAGNQSAATGVGGSPPPIVAEKPQQEIPGNIVQAGATNADFIITDRLLAHPPTYEEHQNAPTQTSVCLGQSLRIANLTSSRVGLIDTPDESDASSTLGFVKPGAIFNLVPEEAGTFFISAAGGNGLLFRYVARRCPGAGGPAK